MLRKIQKQILADLSAQPPGLFAPPKNDIPTHLRHPSEHHRLHPQASDLNRRCCIQPAPPSLQFSPTLTGLKSGHIRPAPTALTTLPCAVLPAATLRRWAPHDRPALNTAQAAPACRLDRGSPLAAHQSPVLVQDCRIRHASGPQEVRTPQGPSYRPPQNHPRPGPCHPTALPPHAAVPWARPWAAQTDHKPVGAAAGPMAAAPAAAAAPESHSPREWGAPEGRPPKTGRTRASAD